MSSKVFKSLQKFSIVFKKSSKVFKSLQMSSIVFKSVQYLLLLHISSSWVRLSSHTEFKLPRMYRSDLTLSCTHPHSDRVNYKFLLHIFPSWVICCIGVTYWISSPYVVQEWFNPICVKLLPPPPPQSARVKL